MPHQTSRSVADVVGTALVCVAVCLLAACAASVASTSTAAASRTATTPATTGSRSTVSSSGDLRVSTQRATAFARPAHVVIVVMENHSYSDIIGNPDAPYIAGLVAKGTSLTQMYGVGHPSEPNYLALFSGSTHGLSTDACPLSYQSSSLGSELLAAHHSFVGYSDGLPSAGSTVCLSGAYARKHVPWTDFPLPASVNQPFTAFPADYTRLPAVSFVIPNLAHDMHDGSVAAGDAWLRLHLDAYVRWAATHHSMLVLTFDEDDKSESNRIPTVIVGQDIRHKAVTTRLTHYSTLRLVEDLYGLHRLGYSATAAPILLP